MRTVTLHWHRLTRFASNFQRVKNASNHSNVWKNSQGKIGEVAALPVNVVTLDYLLTLQQGKFIS
jgi:hypothetical protein